MSDKHRPKPAPLTDGLSDEYWNAARDRRLLIQRCSRCGEYQFYPRRHCTACFAADPEWVQASGRGRLHTFSVVRVSTNPEFARDCPYVFAIVELEEGVRLATRIVDTSPDLLACDAPVRVLWAAAPSEPPLPVFTVIDEARERAAGSTLAEAEPA